MLAITQSKNAITVRTGTVSVLWAVLVLGTVHGIWTWTSVLVLIRNSHFLVGGAVGLVFASAYTLLIYLCFGPFADRVTVTFNSAKFQVSIERLWIGRIRTESRISFEEIERFEISPPENRGFCRARLTDGGVRVLFRIGKSDDFSMIRRLEEITRKKTDLVM